ncbi:acyltransferase-like protein [Isoptericola sp. CG 20/1183]|uniref:Acyltransferase-like protein n=1 Tax=Isoptericola halotolerans TaxID=300560 RepID=A0ABX5EBR6_9MICO|nr:MULTISPECIES: acyltransferase family protein [Isoptericola]PRZ04918.1 acyltransferase-like protein [Isoptericola halotolerans]PRZ05409.1 acyltransferase-like protein [Isoptericola sp. CG 20/1183]
MTLTTTLVPAEPAPRRSALSEPDRPPAPASPPVAAGRAGPRQGRDGFVDAIRALGIVAVVALHWLMVEATWDGSTLRVGNALGHGAGWTVTWLQTLPLLFLAAGAAAAYRSSRTLGLPGRWWRALGGSVLGAARPVVVLLGVWALAVVAMLAVGVPDDAVRRLARMVPQPLWFLGVWVVLVALAPLLQRAWRRWRWGAAGVVVALPLAVDALRFGAGIDGPAWANVLLAWAVPFGAGVAYATDRRDGRRAVPNGRSLLVTGALTALAGAALLIAVGPYPVSLIGMPGAEISNLAPPTAPVVLHAVAMVCLALAARPVLARWAEGAGRTVVRPLAQRSMTVYLWHLTAMFAVVGMVLLGFGQSLPDAWSADWWASRPVWFGAGLLVLAGLVRVFGRFEASRAGTTDAPTGTEPVGAS